MAGRLPLPTVRARAGPRPRHPLAILPGQQWALLSPWSPMTTSKCRLPPPCPALPHSPLPCAPGRGRRGLRSASGLPGARLV
eukprot:9445704-Alexandrium_andersonii.AAC.1